ncbi:MAG: hypothetical protein L0Y75_06420 [Acidobacteria bacterium]|nr:hypothetical protein [Acidobacteriota bacterium]
MKERTSTISTLRCSFCAKEQNEVKKLIAGPSVYICSECIDICIEIFADDARQGGVELRKILPALGRAYDLLNQVEPSSGNVDNIPNT